MAFISVTRLRLRSWRYLPLLFWHSLRSKVQAARADGNIAVHVDKAGEAFWTISLWRDQAAMRAFMMSGAHRKAMPHLKDWCDEAAVAHWEQDGDALPTLAEAKARLARAGRVSVLTHPSTAHAAGHTLGSEGAR